QWGIFHNGRKPDGAMPRGVAVIQRMQALSGMIGRKASVGGNYQAGVRGANGIRYPSIPSRKRWILGAVRIDPCMSWGWRKILKLRPIIRKFIWSKIGNGRNTSLWFDTWADFEPLAATNFSS
ncbi:hypothetical protein Tco_0288466, partial [Tanacetum coccineum]